MQNNLNINLNDLKELVDELTLANRLLEETNIKELKKIKCRKNIFQTLFYFSITILLSFTLYQNYQLSQKNSILERKIETNLNLNENLKMNREVHISNNPPSNKQAIKISKITQFGFIQINIKLGVERY